MTLYEEIEAIVAARIETAMVESENNVGRAAVLLGMNRTTLAMVIKRKSRTGTYNMVKRYKTRGRDGRARL